MGNKLMSAAELAVAPRITPSGIAEQAYQLKQNRQHPVGPAGWPVAPAQAIFRREADRKPIYRLALAAFWAALPEDLQGKPRWAQEPWVRARVWEVISWPGLFRRREGRFPRWAEIERAFPVFGAFMADQRRLMAERSK